MFDEQVEQQRAKDPPKENLFLCIILVAIIAYLAYQLNTQPHGKTIYYPMDPKVEPKQLPISTEEYPPFEVETTNATWTISPRATFDITARVLGAKDYQMDWQSHLSPVDLALGWSILSDEKVDEWLNWGQSERWYWYRWRDGSPIQGKDIIFNSSNIHMIPATDNLKRTLVRLSKNDIVKMEGFLVDIDTYLNGQPFTWKTSTSRFDTGKDSCEIFYVNKIIVGDKSYE